MKKLLALILAALMLVTLSACSDKEDEKNDELKDYLQKEEVVNQITNEKGETFYFDSVDSESVTITGYQGSDVPHMLEVPETLNGKTVVGISTEAFYYCSKINGITLPATVTTIGDFAFAGCALITSVTIPATVEYLGEGAFQGCTGLESLTFENGSPITEIASYAFHGCSALTSVTIPANIDTVNHGAFLDCSALKEITIENGVKIISGQAFQNCTALEKLSLPASLEEIGQFAFSGSEHLYLEGITCPTDESSVAYDYVHNILNATNKPVEENTDVGTGSNVG